MKLSHISGEESVCREAFMALKNIMAVAEKRFNTKLYLDSRVGIGKSWLESCVYIHGDRNVVNLVCLKLITWQHNNLPRGNQYLLYAYPAEDMDK